MTRINVVDPATLSRQHLVAEYRELPRIFALSYAAQQRNEDPKTHPTEYTLGKGHVKFFYTRLGWLSARFLALVAEMQKRGYKTTYTTPPAFPHKDEWQQDWTPTVDAVRINTNRINERSITSLNRQRGYVIVEGE